MGVRDKMGLDLTCASDYDEDEDEDEDEEEDEGV